MHHTTKLNKNNSNNNTNSNNNNNNKNFNNKQSSTASLLSSSLTSLSSSSSLSTTALNNNPIDDLHTHLQQHHHLYHQTTTPPTTTTTLSATTNILNSSIASIDLEQYIEAMEARTTANERNPETDVWAQLQQKESDILLAAELGKALLEKNEELVKQQEKLIEDYSAKIEVSLSLYVLIHLFLLFIVYSYLNCAIIITFNIILMREICCNCLPKNPSKYDSHQ